MNADHQSELMPIGRVVDELVRTDPNVTHSSLRFFEREGLVHPTRTAGGHRLYSRADVERIHQIKLWQARRLSLAEIRRRLAALDQLPSPANLAVQFLDRALNGDQAGAGRLIHQADDLGMPLAQIFGDVLQPALYEVGQRWEAGTLPVGQEKEISALTAELVAELSQRHAHPEPDGPLALTSCVAGERHGLGVQMVAGLLREIGWRVHLLGVDVEPRFLLQVVRLRRPAVVLLTAALEARLPAIRATIRAVNAGGVGERPVIVVGGQAVRSHIESVRTWGAIAVAERGISQAVDAVLVAANGHALD